MSSHVVVIDSTFRRTTVKTEPGTYMSDILEKGCKQLGFKAEKYVLKHNKKNVDMTRTFRQTGLVSGAKLELVQGSKSAAPVSVALQLPESIAENIPNGRLTGTFSSATTFWTILRYFESDGGRNLNITGRGVAQTQQGMTGAGRIFYEQPVCQVMGRELANILDLQKSLASLGFNSGSCMIRLNFRVTATPLEEAMTEISAYFKSIEPETAETPKSETQAAPMPDNAEAEKPKDVQDDDLMSFDEPETSTVPGSEKALPSLPAESSQDAASSAAPQSTSSTTPNSTILGPGNREITVFSAPTDSTPRAALQPHNEADFVPSLAHVSLHTNRIKSESRNKRLPTDVEAQKLANEKAAQQAAVKSVDIKLRFPDQTTTSAKFTNEDSAKDLYEFAKGLLRDDIKEEQFTLTSMGDKGMRAVPKGDEKLIVGLGFTGRVLVNFNWEQGARDAVKKGPVLKAEYAQKAQNIHVPEVPVVVEDEKEVGEKRKAIASGSSSGGGGGETGGKKIPKWLLKGLGKK